MFVIACGYEGCDNLDILLFDPTLLAPSWGLATFAKAKPVSSRRWSPAFLTFP
jgi:hypothetical protein